MSTRLLAVMAKASGGVKPGAGGKLQTYGYGGKYTSPGGGLSGPGYGTPIPTGPKSQFTTENPRGKARGAERRRLGLQSPGKQGEFEGKVWAERDTTKVSATRTVPSWATNGDPEGNSTAPLTKEAITNLGKLGYLVPVAQQNRDRKILQKKLRESPDPTPTEVRRFASGKRLKQKNYDRKAQKRVLLKENGDGHTCGCTHCGTRIGFAQMELDKIIPARGYKLDNLVPSCRGCNVGREQAHQLGGGMGRIPPVKVLRSQAEKSLTNRRSIRVKEGRIVKALLKALMKVIMKGEMVVFGDVKKPVEVWSGRVRKSLYTHTLEGDPDYPEEFIPDIVSGVLNMTEFYDTETNALLWMTTTINGWEVEVPSLKKEM